LLQHDHHQQHPFIHPAVHHTTAFSIRVSWMAELIINSSSQERIPSCGVF
jgi:hypothetical protein